MRFFHISDLHIGKRVNGFSMLEDQKVILRQILDLAEKYCPDGILIAGDLYDKTMPSGEAVETADEFLFQFAEKKIPVWAVSGNHDSPERIAYGSRMMVQAESICPESLTEGFRDTPLQTKRGRRQIFIFFLL